MPSCRAAWRAAVSSVAHVSSGYARSLRPCIASTQRTPSAKHHPETSFRYPAPSRFQTMQDPWKLQVEALGAFLRAQRQMADLSLRELGALTNLSNAYLSQIERGLHEPSVRVLRSLAEALGVPPETLLAKAGLLDEDQQAAPESPPAADAEEAIRADPALSESQKEALLSVYRSFLAERG
jgi:transcriptional regulator with XRE-family HTH domain